MSEMVQSGFAGVSNQTSRVRPAFIADAIMNDKRYKIYRFVSIIMRFVE